MSKDNALIANTGAAFQTARIWRVLWAGSALFILYATTIPFAFVSDPVVVQDHLARVIQRASLAQLTSLSRTDVVQNVLFFVPFGLLGVVSLTRRRTLAALIATLVAAAVLSTACETLQLFTADRISSAWDVGANVTGAFIGGLGYVVARAFGDRISRRFEPGTLTSGTNFPLICAAILVLIGAWEPFDFTLDVGTVWSKVKPLLNETLGQWQPLTDEPLAALRYGLLTALACDRIQRHHHRWRSRLIAIVSGTVLAAALEASQFFITSRAPSLQDLVAAMCGILAGAVWYPSVRRSWRKPRLLVVVSFCAAAPFYLQPFVLSSQYASVPALPFFAYYQRTSLQTVSHVIDLMLIYAPIGFAMEWCGTSRAVAKTAVVAGVLASVLEYSQGWVVGRYPDVTDVAISILGGMLGAAIAGYGRNESIGELPAHR